MKRTWPIVAVTDVPKKHCLVPSALERSKYSAGRGRL